MPDIMQGLNAYALQALGRAAQADPEIIAPAAIHEDFFPADDEQEVICRHDPSPVIVRRYLTGSYWAEFNFSYYARSKNPEAARKTLAAIVDALNIDAFQDLFGIAEGRLNAITRPSPVGEDEAGVITYTSTFRLVYFQEDTP
jgi:hypothetical protein